MTPEFANKVYDILVTFAGANEYWRNDFVRHQTENCYEYRFQGKLGFGGKFRYNGGEYYVDCYSENRTPERDEIMAMVNDKITLLVEASNE